jgi:hypothetical protein
MKGCVTRWHAWLWTLAFGHHEDRTPNARPCGDARGRDGGIRQELAAGIVLRLGCFRGQTGKHLLVLSLTALTPAVIRKHSCDLPIGLRSQTARWKRGIIGPLHE